MDASLLLGNLRAIKRRAKELPELARAATGVAAQAFARDNAGSRVGETRPFAPTPCPQATARFPVTVATPPGGHFMSTFFDVDPFSPSGRYLAVTQIPFLHRIPVPGDRAQVCVIDLQLGTATVVYETRGWGAQLGANVQWGRDDDTLVCNDLIDGRGVGVRVSRATLQATPLEGPVYGLSPDRRHSYAGNIRMINAIIPGYGVPDPLTGRIRQTDRISAREGIWRTDLDTGRAELFASLADLVPQLDAQEDLRGGTYYVFNVKVSPCGRRLLAVLFSRAVPMRAGYAVQLVTIDLETGAARVAMPDRLWRRGGHHPNWAPDGAHIVMNLRREGKRMEFVRFRHDGTELETLAPGHKGSGHPSLNPAGTHLLTDAYVGDGFTDAGGTVPIRLIDLRDNSETAIFRAFTNRLDGPRRVDPHPVWSQDGRRIAFNAVVNGHRQVLIADMAGLG